MLALSHGGHAIERSFDAWTSDMCKCFASVDTISDRLRGRLARALIA